MSPALRGVLFGLLGAFFSACFLIPWKLATQHGDAKHATLALLAAAALFNTLAIVPMHSEKAPPLAVGPTLKLAVVFAVLSLAGNWLSSESVHRVSGALLAVLQRCEVLVVGLLSPLLLRERARPSFWLGAAVAGAGLVVLSTRAGAGLGLGPNADPIGVLYGLASAACFGAMTVLTRKYIRRLRPVLLNATRLWFGVLLWFAIERAVPTHELTTPGLVACAALAAFFGPFLSRLAVMESAHHVAASTTVLCSLVTPPATLLLGFAILGTLPSAHELMGGAIMLFGVAIPVLHTLREERPPKGA